ncbi:tRNA glutamyl-Q(34) synthetase GluQRS [Paludisphaera mucosa]|uniref:Glutamyl-Q tRNA(Asp) synthetase n=1 Tax=Paludisphaera mucosa TaxID=3030827 RepID=A0ABT6FFM4_9BACT|nr:tRNA glutamyl-Q(34) synthetase GluQRS [Paludisphaera mucosa]MDG3006376.1 tRNA glutamyl-Q(34) synthetase GluQRS [Paludisphaera mucosa]
MTFRRDRRPGAGRLAPSPTGGLHVGHARTFLAAWLASRRVGGAMILRVEDLDASRVRTEAADQALVDLRWLGLDWDEGPDVGGPLGPYVQSERRSIYDEALERLKAEERVYPCTCTRADVERAASAPHAEDEGPTYPGTCAGRSALDAQVLGDRPFAWRFRVPPGPVAWDDLFLGPREVDPARLGGDFLIGRNGLGPAYQLAVVVDDAQMGVDQVIRGDDLVPSTPRQILIYRAFGWTPPRFGHVPLVLGPDGRRLAKRDGSIKLATLREQGVDPRRLIGVLAHSLGLSPRPVPSRPADWIAAFDPASVPSTAWHASPDAWKP